MYIVVIPAFKPDDTLVDVVEKLDALIPDRPLPKIVVVDDGSGAGYAGIFQRLRQMENVKVLVHEKNEGKGAALKHAFRFVLDFMPEATTVVTADADGQHLPKDIVAVANFAQSQDRAVLGVREFPPGIPLRSRFGNLVTRKLCKLFFGIDIEDTQTGLRAIPRSQLQDLISIERNRYDFEFEALIRLIKTRTLLQHPIETVYEPGNPSSHFNPLVDSALIYAVFFRHVSAVFFVGVLDWLLFTVFSASGMSIVASLIACRTISAIVYFLVARSIVFRVRERSRMPLQATLFLLLVLANLTMLWGFITLLHEDFGVPMSLAMLLGNGIQFGSNFLWQRYVIFRQEA